MRAARVDRNQKEIVQALRRIGATVHCTHMVGEGFPDIVVGFRKNNYLFEIKDPLQPSSRRQLTAYEKIFHRDWRGLVHIVMTVEDAIAILNQE